MCGSLRRSKTQREQPLQYCRHWYYWCCLKERHVLTIRTATLPDTSTSLDSWSALQSLNTFTYGCCHSAPHQVRPVIDDRACGSHTEAMVLSTLVAAYWRVDNSRNSTFHPSPSAAHFNNPVTGLQSLTGDQSPSHTRGSCTYGSNNSAWKLFLARSVWLVQAP